MTSSSWHELLTTDIGHRSQLTALQEEFPCFRIWREETCDRARYIARSLHPG
jgi:hypothetical protein